MICSSEARAARKKAQLARDAAATKPGFAAVYASQPGQIRIAAEQGAIRKAERAAKNALAALSHADASASAEIFSSGMATPQAVEEAGGDA